MSAGAESAGACLFDAHCHLYDAKLRAVLEWRSDDSSLPTIGAHVVNGTHPDNWQTISELKGIGSASILPAYGVHPWRVDELPDDWEALLLQMLNSGAVSVGEIGLDCWIEPRDDALQRDVFMRQMAMAAELNLPPSIHCVSAYGALLDCLRVTRIPEKGFLSHGFGGSKEVLFQLLDMGGYVSFSAYGAHSGRKRIRDAIRACPVDRILIETDAPDMVPPEEVCQFTLKSENGERLHHPAELQTAYHWVADLKGVDVEEFKIQISENFNRLFSHRDTKKQRHEGK